MDDGLERGTVNKVIIESPSAVQWSSEAGRVRKADQQSGFRVQQLLGPPSIRKS